MPRLVEGTGLVKRNAWNVRRTASGMRSMVRYIWPLGTLYSAPSACAGFTRY